MSTKKPVGRTLDCSGKTLTLAYLLKWFIKTHLLQYHTTNCQSEQPGFGLVFDVPIKSPYAHHKQKKRTVLLGLETKIRRLKHYLYPSGAG